MSTAQSSASIWVYLGLLKPSSSRAIFSVSIRYSKIWQVRIYTCADLHLCGFTPVRIYTCVDLNQCGFTPVRIYKPRGFTPTAEKHLRVLAFTPFMFVSCLLDQNETAKQGEGIRKKSLRKSYSLVCYTYIYLYRAGHHLSSSITTLVL